MDGNTAQQVLLSRHTHRRASVPATGSRLLAGLPDTGLGQPPSPAQNQDLTGSAALVTDFLRGSTPTSTRCSPACSLTPIGLVCRPNLGAALLEKRTQFPVTDDDRLAMCPPMPWHPSTAHVPSDHWRATASIARYPAALVPNRPPPSTVSSLAIISIVADRLCGSIPITTLLIRCCWSLQQQLPSQEGTATSSGGKPLLGLACPNAASGPPRPCESQAGRRAAEKRATGQVPGPSLAWHRS
jgi:hypothetical protein